MLPASVFIVPFTVPVDATHFHSLDPAALAAGTGGMVTIEPGATPDFPPIDITQTGLTVQGDPSVSGTILPTYDINVKANNVTLTNLRLGTVQMGGGFRTTVISRCIVKNITEAGAVTGNGSDLITQDTITGNVTLTGNSVGSTADFITNNILYNSATFMVSLTSSVGTIVQSNQFISSNTNGVAIYVKDSGTFAEPVLIANNTIAIGAPLGTGIFLTEVNGTLSAKVLNNSVTAPDGLATTMANALNFRALVQGNDFHNDMLGVNLRGDNSSTLQVDLGGGMLGSLGGNNFRGFTAKGGQFAGAISLGNTGAVTVSAQANIFQSGVNPNFVIDDSIHGSADSSGTLDVSGALNSGRSFVQTLYQDLLGRTGTIAELDPWVNLLSTGGQQAVVHSILNSSESLGRIVDGLYVRFLGRQSDAPGRAAWIGFLQSNHTEEEIENAFLTSPEYLAHINTDFVQSLYINILGRIGSSAEVASWYSQLQTLGLGGIAAALTGSFENHFNAVQSYFQTFLHRTGSPGDVSAIASIPGSNLLSLEEIVLSSVEFFANG
jgi:hypothetical protein